METPTPQTDAVSAALLDFLNTPTDTHHMAAFLKDPDGRLVFTLTKMGPDPSPVVEAAMLHSFCIEAGRNLFDQYLNALETEGRVVQAPPAPKLVLP